MTVIGPIRSAVCRVPAPSDLPDFGKPADALDATLQRDNERIRTLELLAASKDATIDVKGPQVDTLERVVRETEELALIMFESIHEKSS